MCAGGLRFSFFQDLLQGNTIPIGNAHHSKMRGASVSRTLQQMSSHWACVLRQGLARNRYPFVHEPTDLNLPMSGVDKLRSAGANKESLGRSHPTVRRDRGQVCEQSTVQ